MGGTSVESIDAKLAVLCADCERISEARGNCPVCGSAALLNLARVLARPAPPNVEGMIGYSPDIGTFRVSKGEAYAENGAVYPFPPTAGCMYRFLYAQFRKDESGAMPQ